MSQAPSQSFSDDTGDAFACNSGAATEDPAVDIQLFTFFLPPEGPPAVEIFTGQSPRLNFEDYSYSLQARVGHSGFYHVGIYEIHAGVTRIGELATVDELEQGTEDHVIPGPDSVLFTFPSYEPEKGDTVTVRAFHLETDSSVQTCDVSEAFEINLSKFP